MDTIDIIKGLETLDSKLDTTTDFYVDNLWERSIIHTAIKKLKDNEAEIDQLYRRIDYRD